MNCPQGVGVRQNHLFASAAVFLSVVTISEPAHAQVALSINVESDYRLRGYSLSAGRPTATAQIVYDDPSGFYLGGSATGVLARDEARGLGVQGNVGYARRLTPAVTIDGGLIHSEYGSAHSRGYAVRYTEAYMGLIVDPVVARIYYSPNYFHPDASTIYGEIEAGFSPAPNWRLSAHAGALSYVKRPFFYRYYGYGDETDYDWRLSASRQFDRFEVHAALSGGGPGREYYAGKFRDRTGLTAGASFNF